MKMKKIKIRLKMNDVNKTDNKKIINIIHKKKNLIKNNNNNDELL
jgi:hypothetical protein